LEYGAEKIFDFFIECGVKSMAFLPQRPDSLGLEHVRESSDDSYYLGTDVFNEFMLKICNRWLEIDDPTVRIRELDSILSALVGGTHKVCVLSGPCNGKYFGIEPNGDVYHCDKYIPDPSYRLGNIESETLEEIASHEKLIQIGKTIRTDVGMLNCPWTGICNGGCPHDRYIQRTGLGRKRASDCCGWRPLIERLSQHVKASLPSSISDVYAESLPTFN
jgi:uncharacterized protein